MLGSLLNEISKFVNKHDDDAVDRYSHRYTVMILSVFVFLIASKQYFGEPIICWTPAQFTGSHNSYTNAVCWTHGTYPVGTDQLYHTVDRTKVLPYYQWVPFILMFQAFCFSLPNILWHSLSKQTGIDASSLIKSAIKIDNVNIDEREKLIDKIGDHIQISLTTKYEYEPFFKRFNIRKRLPFGKRYGNYLYLIYLMIKLLYILNLFAQLFLMNFFFGFHYHSFGVEILTKFINRDDYWANSKSFPRITYCDFKIRNMADNIHKYSVQCALPINLFNEKFFICLWFWLIALAFITIWNFLKWTLMIFPIKRKSFIEHYLKAKLKIGGNEKDGLILDAFVTEYCHLDGSFIFALIRENTNFIITTEIMSAVWDKFYKQYTSSRDTKGLLEIKNNIYKSRNSIDYIDEDTENIPLNSKII